MNEKLEEKLFEQHYLLRNSVVESPIPFSMFGIECGDGWYDLLDELLTELEKLIDEKYPHFKVDSKDSFKLTVDQIKEKYGGLRFYISYGNDEILDLIDKFEEKSYKICEICGKEGELKVTRGWYSTLCENHRAERENEYLKLFDK